MTDKQKEKIRLRNQKFANLPDHKKRVVIAKDVLKTLASSKKVVPKAGMYLNGICTASEAKEAYEGTSSAETCSACALGTMMVCGIGSGLLRTHSLPFNRYSGLDQLLRRGGFTRDQLDSIETAFEANNPHFYPDTRYPAAKAFGKRYKTDRGRLKGIMQNIIKNNGWFLGRPKGPEGDT